MVQRKYIVISSSPEGSRTYETDRNPNMFRFSGTEIEHILISMAVLTVAFALFFTNIIAYGFSIGRFLFYLIVAAVGVSTEFLLHELAHKFTAQKYGCWSEYRYWDMGLVITLVSGFLGFLFAAPGVVWHSGYVTQEEEGKISAAGPMVNLALGFAFFAAWFLLPVAAWIKVILWIVGVINVFVGAFNLIPFSPLDGSKIWKWSIPVYIGMWVGFIATGLALYTLTPLGG